MECMRIMAQEIGCPECMNTTFTERTLIQPDGWSYKVLQCDQCDFIIAQTVIENKIGG